MSKYLQQLDNTAKHAARKVGVKVRNVPLNANSALLLVLVLVIIPTISGVSLIA
jgi:hypothetical protein